MARRTRASHVPGSSAVGRALHKLLRALRQHVCGQMIFSGAYFREERRGPHKVIEFVERCATLAPEGSETGRYCAFLADGVLISARTNSQAAKLPRLPNVPLVRALWSILDGIWGILKGSWAGESFLRFGGSLRYLLLSVS